MLRQGMYTGKIYTEGDFQEFRIKECCVLILDENNTEEKNKARYEKIHKKCIDCRGCFEKLKDGKKRKVPLFINPFYGRLKQKKSLYKGGTYYEKRT